MITVRNATLPDALRVASRMRQRDVEEIRAACGLDPQSAILEGLDLSSACWSLLTPEGEPFALFGVAPVSDMTHVGVPWMLATDTFAKYTAQIVCLAPRYVRLMHNLYDVLVNYVDARNTDSLQFLRWAGFKFTAFEPEFGFERRPFIRFESIRHV